MCKGGISRDETDLTLNEQGLQAVKGFFHSIVLAKKTPEPPMSDAQKDDNPGPSPDLWEPPIDNEVKL